MAKVAIVNIGMHGHVNPTLGFTEALVKHGHEVIYYCTNDFAPQIRKTGAKFVNYPSTMGHFATLVAKGQGPEAAQAAAAAGGMSPAIAAFVHGIDDLEKMLPLLIADFEREQPDVVVYDFVAAAARMAAAKIGARVIKFYTNYGSNEHFDVVKELFGGTPAHDPEMAKPIINRYMAICQANGCQPIDLFKSTGHAEDDNLVFLPQEFQPHGETFDARFHFVGPCLRTADLAPVGELLPPGQDPLIVISLGTLFHSWPEFYTSCLQAFGGKPYRVVMGHGPEIKPESFGTLPENVRIASHLPQVALLKQAALFVTHGGMNSTMEGLYFGVPLLAIPQISEQELTSRRVQELGLGRYLPRAEVNATSLANAAHELLTSPETKANLAAMRAEIMAGGGNERVVAVVESVVAKGRLSPAAPAADTGKTQNGEVTSHA